MAAQALGRPLGVSVLLVDDLRLAVQALTTPESLPGLHVFRSDRAVGALPPEEARGSAGAATRGRRARRVASGGRLAGGGPP